MKTPVTHKRLQNHLTYSWWKYVLMMVLVIFFWSILFTTTRYRPPEEKKVIVGVYGAGNQTALDAYMEDVRQLRLSMIYPSNSKRLSDSFSFVSEMPKYNSVPFPTSTIPFSSTCFLIYSETVFALSARAAASAFR